MWPLDLISQKETKPVTYFSVLPHDTVTESGITSSHYLTAVKYSAHCSVPLLHIRFDWLVTFTTALQCTA